MTNSNNGNSNSNSNSNNDNGAHANDNGAHEHQETALGAVPSVSTGGAVTSPAALDALRTALNKVAMTNFSGRAGKLLMQYKSRENLWVYGQQGINPDVDGLWGFNPLSPKHGWVCFPGPKKQPVERMVPVTQPLPVFTELPDLGAPWQPQRSVDLKCLSGPDAGVDAIYKTTTDGGAQAFNDLLAQICDRLNTDEHRKSGKVAPIARLGSQSYPHHEFGKVWKPILTIVDWMHIDGPAPATEPASPPPPVPPASSTSAAEQPRRRQRVV